MIRFHASFAFIQHTKARNIKTVAARAHRYALEVLLVAPTNTAGDSP
jgi:hypothetical protein